VAGLRADAGGAGDEKPANILPEQQYGTGLHARVSTTARGCHVFGACRAMRRVAGQINDTERDTGDHRGTP